MAITKRIKSKASHTAVIFTIAESDIQHSSDIYILGDFNDWQASDSCKMKKDNDAFVKELKLENGKRYEFRYYSETKGWFNDSSADSYSQSFYEGFHNCVVDLSAASKTKTTKAVKKKATTKKATAKKAPITKKSKKDNLTKIEGIGPKIASILTDNGVETFEKLSKASVKKLSAILKEAGPRFAMHKPDSWPKQAKLASQDKWDELKQLQDVLDRGR